MSIVLRKIFPKNKNTLRNDIFEDNKNILNLLAYESLSLEDFQKKLQEYQNIIPLLSSNAINRIHLEMAALYLSQGFSEKALEILSLTPKTKEQYILSFLAYVSLDMKIKALDIWKKIQNPDENLILWNNPAKKA